MKNILIRDGETVKLIDLNSVIYIESIGNYYKIYPHELSGLGSLNNLLKQNSFPNTFIRCHRKYVINTDYMVQIRSATKNESHTGEYEAIMSNGSIVPVSRREYVKIRTGKSTKSLLIVKNSVKIPAKSKSFLQAVKNLFKRLFSNVNN